MQYNKQANYKRKQDHNRPPRLPDKNRNKKEINSEIVQAKEVSPHFE